MKRVLGILVASCSLALAYAFIVEPQWLEITRHRISLPISRLKIAQLSDLHITKIGGLESRILRALQDEAPDLIVITGDVLADQIAIDDARIFLRQLNAPLGVYMVDGNWDHWMRPESGLRDLAEASVTLLRNRGGKVRDDVWIVGLDDALAGQPDVDLAFSVIPKEAVCISIFHSPEYFSKVQGRCVLNLAGHTHGGQVSIPWYGPMWLPPGSGKYVSGFYGAPGSRLYVSRGSGTSILPLRFFSRPELAIFEIGN